MRHMGVVRLMRDIITRGVIGEPKTVWVRVIGTEGRLENFGDRPGDTVKVWNTGPTAYRDDCDIAYRVPEAVGSHGGADAEIVEEFCRFVRDGSGSRSGAVPELIHAGRREAKQDGTVTDGYPGLLELGYCRPGGLIKAIGNLVALSAQVVVFGDGLRWIT